MGIATLLVGIALPGVAKARDTANTLKCVANLRSVGQGMQVYLSENRGFFPTAYLFKRSIAPGNASYADQPRNAPFGYVHWSYYLYGPGSTAKDAFTCPSFLKGGVPPPNPSVDNFDDGQTAEHPGIVDDQAPRMAYTLNEAICGRSKFYPNFHKKNVRWFVTVNVGRIRQSASTILATEYVDDWKIFSGNTNVCKSFRPVHGFCYADGQTGKQVNGAMACLPLGNAYRRLNADDLRDGPVAEL
jgi:hypothetical protein